MNVALGAARVCVMYVRRLSRFVFFRGPSVVVVGDDRRETHPVPNISCLKNVFAVFDELRR